MFDKDTRTLAYTNHLFKLRLTLSTQPTRQWREGDDLTGFYDHLSPVRVVCVF
ncbi:hypothetical protein KDK_19930 [Dictyobacter kobayashii]|uniref:Uncharacterized protein n=1 Tax=Dictyobacter kobayashii TaxID=2014872 RepID=A0A402AGL4_9CHLR|nr:hypothetical protein KDK_19930 [Dictyobacter kobayashii]